MKAKVLIDGVEVQEPNGIKGLTQEEVDKEAKIYEDVSRTYNASKDDIKEELKPQLLYFISYIVFFG